MKRSSKLFLAVSLGALSVVGLPLVPLRTAVSAAVILPAPTFSVPGGDSAALVSVALSSATVGASIYYTLDGNDPGPTTTRYTVPLTISQPTAVRAMVVLGADTSPIATRTFVVGVTHDLPIVAIAAPPALFFDPATGLFPNATLDIEADTNVEFYDTNGTQAFSQIATTEVQGTATAGYAQKSLAFKAKKTGTFAYPLYTDRPYQQYKSFVVRNSGQDWNYSMFRDTMVQDLAGDLGALSGVIRQPNIDWQASRPVVAYLNGKYYGLLNMQERADSRYVDTHYGVPKANLDLIENEIEIKEGDKIFYNEMTNFAKTRDLSLEANYVEFAKYYDIDNLIDTYAFMVYVDATDWPGNNIVVWRNRVANGPFRSLIKDLDFSLGLNPIGGVWNSGDATGNSLARLMTENGYQHPNPSWSTVLFRGLIKNASFRDQFVNRLNDEMNYIFTPSRITSRVNELSVVYEPERKRHLTLYAGGVEVNADKAEASMKLFAANRPSNLSAQIDAAFPTVSSRSVVTASVSPAGSGGVDFSSLTLRGANLPHANSYFRGTQIPLKAVAPAAGFTFSRWVVTGGTVANATAASTSFVVTGNATVQALFTTGNGPAAQTINFPTIGSKTTTSAPFALAAVASSGLPVTYSVTSGPASVSGNIVTLSGTQGTVIIAATQAGDANFLPVTVSHAFAVTSGGTVCAATSAFPWHEWLSKVTFADLAKDSVKTAYSDFTSSTATVTAGQAYQLGLTTSFSYSAPDEALRVWIDFNDNKVFDTNELVLDRLLAGIPDGSSPALLTGAATIPAGATKGQVRMRVVLSRTASPAPCGSVAFGEVEDYTVNIQ